MQLTRFVCLIASALLFVVTGCGQKSSSPGTDTTRNTTSSNVVDTTIARVHWLGKTKLNAETNAAHFMSIWNMSESAALENQTLNKLALAPWRLTKGDDATNGAPIAALRTLLDDLVQMESCLEVRQTATNLPLESVLAIRLSAERHAVWETNLAATLESLTGLKAVAVADGWSLKKHDAPDLIQLSRAGDWTLVSLAWEESALLGEFKARIQREHTPFPPRVTNYWLDAEVDLAKFSDTFKLGWKFPAGLPKVSLTQIGDGKNVRTRGEILFPKPLELELEPWNIPTNLIHEPLVSFSAVRGNRYLIESLQLWKPDQLGEIPNQMYFWGLGNSPFQSYFAWPTSDSSSQVAVISDFMMGHGNVWALGNGLGKFERIHDSLGIRWSGIPFIQPYILSYGTLSTNQVVSFVVGGFFPDVRKGLPMPLGLQSAILSRADLIAYDWECTKDRIEGWNGISQIMRLSSRNARVPRDSISSVWLRVAKTNTAQAISTIALGSLNRVSICRDSSLGMTGVEFQLLVDWLESPRFPSGLYSLEASPSEPIFKDSKSNHVQ